MRCVTRNAHYIVLLRSPRAMGAVSALNQQIWPHRKNFLQDAYVKATKQPYGYLFLNLHPTTEERLMVLSHVLPSEGYTHVFV